MDASIDQSNITQVKAGQKVDITLDAYPNEHISGTVSLVALQGTIVSNVTTFTVTAMVDQVTDLLRAGMNANIDIAESEATNVLTVPSEAIKTSGTMKQVIVPVTTIANTPAQARPATQNVTVEVGLDDGTNVEIKSGLKEGQEVVIGTSSSTTTTTTKSSSGLLGGGGGSAGGPPPN